MSIADLLQSVNLPGCVPGANNLTFKFLANTMSTPGKFLAALNIPSSITPDLNFFLELYVIREGF